MIKAQNQQLTEAEQDLRLRSFDAVSAFNSYDFESTLRCSQILYAWVTDTPLITQPDSSSDEPVNIPTK